MKERGVRLDKHYLTKGNVKALNRSRKSQGLMPINVKSRPCLRCDFKFLSIAINHRLCDNCNNFAKSNTEWGVKFNAITS